MNLQGSRQVIGHEHGPQLAQAESAGRGAQRRAVQEDARLSRGGRGGRGVGRHGAEHALEDGGPLQLERQASGGWLAAQYWGHARALQVDHSPDHMLGHLKGNRPVSGPRGSHLLAALPRRAGSHLPLPKARLKRAPRRQEVPGTQVAGARLLEPQWAARPQGRIEGPQSLLHPKTPCRHGDRKARAEPETKCWEVELPGGANDWAGIRSPSGQVHQRGIVEAAFDRQSRRGPPALLRPASEISGFSWA